MGHVLTAFLSPEGGTARGTPPCRRCPSARTAGRVKQERKDLTAGGGEKIRHTYVRSGGGFGRSRKERVRLGLVKRARWPVGRRRGRGDRGGGGVGVPRLLQPDRPRHEAWRRSPADAGAIEILHSRRSPR
jgi:hypothetical protein